MDNLALYPSLCKQASPLLWSFPTCFVFRLLQMTVRSLELAANTDIKQIIECTEDFNMYRSLSKHLQQHGRNGKVLVFGETRKGCDPLTRSL